MAAREFLYSITIDVSAGTVISGRFAPILSTDLPADVAYTDKANTFTQPQTFVNVATGSASAAVDASSTGSGGIAGSFHNSDGGTFCVLQILNTWAGTTLAIYQGTTGFVRFDDDGSLATNGNFDVNGWVLVRPDASIQPAQLADADAANDSLYFSTDANKLAYKDSGGVVNNLY